MLAALAQKYTWCDIQYFQLDPSINLCPEHRQIPFRRKWSDFIEIGFKMLAVVFCLQKIDFPPRPDPQGASRVARIKLFKFGKFSGFRPQISIFDSSLTLFFRQISFRGLCVKKNSGQNTMIVIVSNHQNFNFHRIR